MRDQIKFMSEKLEASQAELELKEELVRQLVNEKREANRNVESLENLNFELQEKLSLALSEAEKAKKDSQNLSQQLIVQADLKKKQSAENLLEADDGLKLIDLNSIDPQRLSVGSKGSKGNKKDDINGELVLLQELERVKGERDDFRR